MAHSMGVQGRPKTSRSHEEQERELHREIRPQLALASVSALLVGVAYLLRPDTRTVGPNWLVLAVEAVALLPLTAAAYFRPYAIPVTLARGIRTGLQVALTLALLSSIALLVDALPTFQHGRELLRPAALLWMSNILIFADWYWELDGGGPAQRHRRGHQAGDFLFPQYTMQGRSQPASSASSASSSPSALPRPPKARGRAEERAGRRHWMPGFVDYAFLAFCFATALSPADTAPLTPRAKLLMMAEALLSLVIATLLIARFINIL